MANTSKFFTDWAVESAPQALRVLERMLNSSQGMRVGQEEQLNEIRAAAAEAMRLHPQSEEIRAFAAGL